MAQHRSGGPIRLASTAYPIRRVGVGAQGRFKRIFLSAHVAGVYAVCTEVRSQNAESEKRKASEWHPVSNFGPLLACFGVFCPGTDVQTHAGDAAHYSNAARLLAVAKK